MRHLNVISAATLHGEDYPLARNVSSGFMNIEAPSDEGAGGEAD
jgi:hypothetical protein